MQARKLPVRSIRRWALFAAAVAILASCESPIPDNFHLKSANERKPTPDFALKDATGATVKLSDYKGKVVLLNFWATWCGPCKVEIPGFNELYKKYKADGLEVLGVVLLDKFENAKPYAEKMNMAYPVLNGDEQQDKIDDAYGPLFGLPMSFIISREGRVCQKHLGLPGATKDKDPDAKTVKDIFEQQIKALL
jgi:peroxiredoxin